MIRAYNLARGWGIEGYVSDSVRSELTDFGERGA